MQNTKSIGKISKYHRGLSLKIRSGQDIGRTFIKFLLTRPSLISKRLPHVSCILAGNKLGSPFESENVYLIMHAFRLGRAELIFFSQPFLCVERPKKLSQL